VNATELNADGQITRLSSIWDGSLADRGRIIRRRAEVIEQ